MYIRCSIQATADAAVKG